MDSILSDEPSVHSLPETAESDSPVDTVAESTSADTAADKGATPEPKQAKEAAPAQAEKSGDDDSDDGPVPGDLDGFKKALAASRGDKRKYRKQWQETERKLAVLEGQLSVLRQQPKSQQPEKVEAKEPTREELENEFWKDPAGFVQKHGRGQAVNPEQVVAKTKIELSEFYARQSHKDYDEKVNAFLAAAQKQPHLFAQMSAAPSPAEFAYQTGTLYLEAEEVGGDIGAWRERERAKIKAELEASMTSQVTEEPRTVTVRPPKSIAGARGNGVGAKQAWSGPRSLDDILG